MKFKIKNGRVVYFHVDLKKPDICISAFDWALVLNVVRIREDNNFSMPINISMSFKRRLLFNCNLYV